MSGPQMRAFQEGMANLHAAPVGAACSSHSHLGDTSSTHAPADHGHSHHYSKAGNTIAARQRAQQNQIKTLEDKFSQTLAKYITTYRALGEEMTINATHRAPLARYAGQTITAFGTSDVSGDGGHCPLGGYSIINQENGKNWCCGPKENILHASPPGPDGVRTATCKPGGISYESSAYENARYINSFGYAQSLSPQVEKEAAAQIAQARLAAAQKAEKKAAEAEAERQAELARIASVEKVAHQAQNAQVAREQAIKESELARIASVENIARQAQ